MEDIDSFQGLDCGVCFERYDLTTHLPRILPHCGHTLCSDCINKMISPLVESRKELWFEPHFESPFTCPFDKTDVPFPVTSLSQFPPNFQLKTVIEARPPQVYCQEHHKPLDYVCLTHDVRICGDCILLGDHKNSKDHNIQAFNKIKPFYTERKEYLANVKEEICSFHPDIELLKKSSKNQKDKSMITIRQCFKEIKAFIEGEENKQLLAVNNFFESRVQNAQEKYIEYQDLKKEIEEKINESKRTNSREGPVKSLAEDVWQFTGKLEALKRTFTSEDFFEDFLEKLELSLATKLSAIYSLKFDTNQIYNEISSFEQAEKLLLQDFDLILKTLDLTDECKSQFCLSEAISNSISRSMETLQGLNRICISSKNTRIFFPDMMQKLQKVRVFLQNVQNLCICLNHSEEDDIDEQTLQKFLQIVFWNPLSISQIRLRLCTPAITDDTIRFLSNKVFPRTLNLQYLYIDFDQKNMTSQAIDILLLSLASISANLISLELDFSKLSSFNLGSFPCIGFLLPKLKNFHVKFCNTPLNDNSFDVFLKNTMDSLIEIRKFSLDLLATKVTERKASEMFKKILSVFLNCQELRLGMSITDVSKPVLHDFMKQSLLKLEKLEKISVFGSHGEIQHGFDEMTA